MTEAIVFSGGEDFEALRAAQNWCHENGYSVGRLQADAPAGILRGTGIDIAKWRNLSARERAELDGVMDAPGRSYRSGPVTIRMRAAMAEVARERQIRLAGDLERKYGPASHKEEVTP